MLFFGICGIVLWMTRKKASLDDLMRERKLTTGDLAGEIGYSAITVSKWREGRRQHLHPGTIVVVAEALEMSPDEVRQALAESARRYQVRQKKGLDGRKNQDGRLTAGIV